jgi:hypothetical protein
LLFNSKDNVGIILKGVETEESGDFDGIKILKNLDFPTIKIFQELDRIDVTNENGSGDCKLILRKINHLKILSF